MFTHDTVLAFGVKAVHLASKPRRPSIASFMAGRGCGVTAISIGCFVLSSAR